MHNCTLSSGHDSYFLAFAFAFVIKETRLKRIDSWRRSIDMNLLPQLVKTMWTKSNVIKANWSVNFCATMTPMPDVKEISHQYALDPWDHCSYHSAAFKKLHMRNFPGKCQSQNLLSGLSQWKALRLVRVFVISNPDELNQLSVWGGFLFLVNLQFSKQWPLKVNPITIHEL